MKWHLNLFTVLLCLLLLGCEKPSKENEIKKGPFGDKLYSTNVPYYPTEKWRVAKPEDQGMDSTKLYEFFNRIEQWFPSTNSTIIVRNGYIVGEKYNNNYDPNIKQYIYSATKSLMSSLIGIGVDKQIISTNENVTEIFKTRNIKNLDENKRKIQVKDLLTMRSGLVYHEKPMYQQLLSSHDPVQFMLDLPMKEAPNITSNYSSGNSHLLSAIIQEKSEMKTMDFAQTYLFEPLGIKNTYFAELNGVALGGNGLMMTPRDLAKIGQLYLNMGEWEGKQIISKDWINISTNKSSDDKIFNSYYGYHWFIDEVQGIPFYYAAGSLGQYLFVFPKLDMVIAITGGKEGPNQYSQFINLISSHVIEAVKSDNPIAENIEGYKVLLSSELRSNDPNVESNTKFNKKFNNKIHNKTFALGQNIYGYDRLLITFNEDQVKLILTNKNGETQSYNVGIEKYIVNQTECEVVTAVMGKWEDNHTFKLHFRELESIYDYSWTIKYDDNYQSFNLVEADQDRTLSIRGTLEEN